MSLSILKYLFFISLILVFLGSCKKIENYDREIKFDYTKFFQVSDTVPLSIKKVISEFNRQNLINEFIPEFSQKVGFPNWNKCIIELPSINSNTQNLGENPQDTIIYIPIVKDEEQYVSSFIVAKLSNLTTLHLFREKDYQLKPEDEIAEYKVTQERITLELMELNKFVYGYTKFDLIDFGIFSQDILFPDSADQVTIQLDDVINTSNNKMYLLTICTFHSSSFTSGITSLINPCQTYIFPIDVPTNWPETGQSPTPDGGSGGGGNPPPMPDCTGIQDCLREGSQIIDGKIPCGDCGPAPIVILPDDNNNFGIGWSAQTNAPLDRICSNSFNFRHGNDYSFWETNMVGLAFEDGNNKNKFNAYFSLTNGITDNAMHQIISPSPFPGPPKSALEYLQEVFPELFPNDIDDIVVNGIKEWRFTKYAAQKIAKKCADIAAFSVAVEYPFICSTPGFTPAQDGFRSICEQLLRSFVPGSRCRRSSSSTTNTSIAKYNPMCQ